MVEVTEVKSNKHGVTLHMNNGVVLTVIPHKNYMYFNMGGIEVPTTINNDMCNYYNNVLCWNYEVMPCE